MSDSSCLSLRVALLEDDRVFGEPLLRDDPLGPYTDYIDLDTVGKVQHNVIPVMDEGNVRPIYIDHTFNVEFIITRDSDIGNLYNSLLEDPETPPFDPLDPSGQLSAIEFNKERRESFQEVLQKIYSFLIKPGLAINFGGFPTSLQNLISSDEAREPGIPGKYEYIDAKQGWIVVSHNGPHTNAVEIESLAGGESALVSWSFTARTGLNDPFNPQEESIPRISSELRLDIDNEGQLEFIHAGTIYADNLRDLYKSRELLTLKYQPEDSTGIGTVNLNRITKDTWAQVNGFLKTVQFNVAKNGRSATFSIKYSQVKSNNALPLGIRDISFEQELESNLFGSSIYQGKAFRTWKNNFSADITIPPRMNAVYAWYVFHLLISQQLRKSNISIEAKRYYNEDGTPVDGQGDPLTGADNGNPEIERLPNGKGFLRTTTTTIRAIPLRMRIRNKHFSKRLQFDLDYVLLSPIRHILYTSSILKRINNDYQRKLDIDRRNEAIDRRNEDNNSDTNEDNNSDTREKYVPLTLSQQWLAWNQSVDSNYRFDPEATNATDGIGPKHSDVGNTEVIDTGHHIDPKKRLKDQAAQENILITTLIDPDDNDPAYPEDLGNPNIGITDIDPTTPLSLDEVSGSEDRLSPSIKPLSITRGIASVGRKESWLEYSQEYEIVEVNNNQQVQSLASIRKDEYTSSKLGKDLGLAYYDKNGVLQPENIDEDTGLPKQDVNANDIIARTGLQLPGRRGKADFVPESGSDLEYQNQDERLGVERRTYAATTSTIKLIVRGYARRAKYKIPMPTVVTIAGEPAIRIGTGRFRHKDLAPDADLPIYQAMWVQEYTVDKNIDANDILETIEDTGASFLYA